MIWKKTLVMSLLLKQKVKKVKDIKYDNNIKNITSNSFNAVGNQCTKLLLVSCGLEGARTIDKRGKK